MRSICNYFLHYALYFCKFVHQIYFIVQTSCSINNYYVCILRYSRLQSIKRNRSRITSHLLFDNRNSYSICPNLKLVNGCCSKRISCSKNYIRSEEHTSELQSREQLVC